MTRPQPRPAVIAMAPYHPPTAGRANKLRLDFNENTVGCSPRVIAALAQLSPADLAIYPEGRSEFSLYEDDGVTRQYAEGRYAWQRFSVDAAETEVQVTIGPSVGEYAGRPERRSYLLRVYGGGPPGVIETPAVPTGDSLTVRLPWASTPGDGTGPGPGRGSGRGG